MTIKHVRIVGTGLIGTSIALGLARAGITLELEDRDPNSRALATDLLKSHLGGGAPEIVVIATPPEAVAETIVKEFASNPKSIFIDVSSVKTKVINEIDALSASGLTFIATHPMAGREVGGAHSAQGDLFQGRAWIVTPSATVSESDVDLVCELISILGATVYRMSAQEHDALMASISHLPQLLSTALATSISNLGSGLELAGQGLRDMTRIANSDSKLWVEIIKNNRDYIKESLDRFSSVIGALDEAMRNLDGDAIAKIFEEGKSGRALVSGKHGAKARNYSFVRVVIEDKPGQLSKIVNQCAEISANIEDLSIEHSPGQETGLITLAFSPEDAQRVLHHLERDWKVYLT